MRVTEETLNRYRSSNRKITLYSATNGTYTISVAAYSTAHALDLIEDYDQPYDLGNLDHYSFSYDGKAKSTGIKSIVVDSENC